ncbi:MAG: hypothetical protein HPY69_06075 [Armatimonadetes bacterium]|nr:hypothetical protein [Armatimonadota bacterium]
MVDVALAALLEHDLGIERATVASGPELGVANPEYVLVASVKGLVQPAGATARSGLLGLYPESSHVVYLAGVVPEVAVGDLVVRRAAQGVLAEPLEVADQVIQVSGALSLLAGDEIEIGEGAGREVRRVAEWSGEGFLLERPVEVAHAEGSPVALRQRYEVLGVEDEAGLGHHRRVVVRRLW